MSISEDTMRIAIIAAAVLAALSAPALAEPSAEATAAVGYAAKLAHGEACGWLVPAERTALRFSADEQAAFAFTKGGEAARAEVQAAIDAAMKVERPCTDKDKATVQISAQVMEDDWVIRAVALLDAEDKHPYAANFSTASKYAPVLRARFQALGEKRTGLSKSMRDPSAEAAIRRLCPERKTVRWQGGQRPCPPLAAADAKNLPVSRVFVDGVEAFAVLYEPPPLPPAEAFFVTGPGHPLYVLSGQPMWQVYRACAQAFHDAADAGKATELTDKAIGAYAAQTGKRRFEVETFVRDAPVVRRPTTRQCRALG